jgi:hypothetical protein
MKDWVSSKQLNIISKAQLSLEIAWLFKQFKALAA